MNAQFTSRLSAYCRLFFQISESINDEAFKCKGSIGFMQDNAFNYDKGVLAEILEPIMGKGLIPADLETWKPRRRAIVPAFHKAYLKAMTRMFCRCTEQSLNKFEALTANQKVRDP